MKYYVYIFLFWLLLSACNNSKQQADEKAIAIAGEKSLSENEYKRFNFFSESVKDSSAMARKLIENWAKDELFYQEAKQKLLPEDMDIEAEVERYRKELINYKYEVKLIENNLDTAVTKEEIQAYYDANRDNFILKDNIATVNYFKIPVASKAIDKFKKAIYSPNPKDKDQLKNLCLQYADNYFMNDSTWLLLEDIKKEIPQLREVPEFNFYAGRYFEFTDSLAWYYLKIKQIKVKDALSPINYESANIKKIILNQRKMKLIRQYKEQVMEKAKSEGKFKIN